MLYLALNQGLLVAIAVANFLIGLYVFLRAPRNPIHARFFVFVAGIAIWIAGFGALSLSASLLADKVVQYGALLMLFGLVLFSRVFPQGTSFPRLKLWQFAPIGIAALFIIPANLLVADIVQHADGRIEPVIGPLLGWYAFGFLAYVAWAFWGFIQSYGNSSAHARLQMKYLFLGIGILFSCLLVGDLFLPAISITTLNLIGPLASIPFVILTSYAIVRHQLMDIRIVIQRSIVYSVLLGLIIGFYICLIQLLRFLVPAGDESASVGAALATTVLGIFTAPHIERFFCKVTDRIFFKDTYDYADAMHTLSEVLYANVEFDDLVHASEQSLASILRASSVRITLGKDSGSAPEPDEVLKVPIELDGTDIGCIHLGKKRSGDPYSPQDTQLLKTFAYQAATALSRAQLYAEAKEHATELEMKVEERTRELSESHERERQMLNDLSHNLQTPLTILQTTLERMKPLIREDDKVRSFERSLARFSGFVYDLLALARLEGGRKPQPSPVGFSELATELAEEIGIIAAGNSVRMKTAIDPNIQVLGDARRLREALMNVASNALKYMREDGPREIGISVHSEGGTISIEIRDTGIGVREEDLPHIFDRFFRAGELPSEKKGTGLGLSIAKRIIEQHGGTIAGKSELGEGTSITISLPRYP